MAPPDGRLPAPQHPRAAAVPCRGPGMVLSEDRGQGYFLLGGVSLLDWGLRIFQRSDKGLISQKGDDTILYSPKESAFYAFGWLGLRAFSASPILPPTEEAL